jgi:hypothetical protein
MWDTSQVPRGDYTLKIIASDFSGNDAPQGQLLLTIR